MKTLVLTLGLVLASFAQANLHADMEPPSAKANSAPDPEASERGGRLYAVYCASCHGDQGRGEGPLASTLDPPVPDLTRLSEANGGEFPQVRVNRSIDGRRLAPGHRQGDMPIWGLALQEPDSDYYQEDTLRKKIEDLSAFVRTLQVESE